MMPSSKATASESDDDMYPQRAVSEERHRHPAPSRVSLREVVNKIMRLVKEDGFDSDDAIRVVQIAKKMDGVEPSTAAEMKRELQAIYARNFHALKKSRARSSSVSFRKRPITG